MDSSNICQQCHEVTRIEDNMKVQLLDSILGHGPVTSTISLFLDHQDNKNMTLLNTDHRRSWLSIYEKKVDIQFKHDFAQPDIYLQYIPKDWVFYDYYLPFVFIPEEDLQIYTIHEQFLRKLDRDYRKLVKDADEFLAVNPTKSIEITWNLRGVASGDVSEALDTVDSDEEEAILAEFDTVIYHNFSYRFPPGSLMGAVCYVLRNGSMYDRIVQSSSSRHVDWEYQDRSLLSQIMMVDIARRIKHLHAINAGYQGNADTVQCVYTVVYTREHDDTEVLDLGDKYSDILQIRLLRD